MGIVVPLALIIFTCLLIRRACDGFEVASEYIGRNLSEGVRGGSINAISSSMPELLTTLIALFVLSDRDGFSVGIGTTAGSALFNTMIIPAVCILTVVGTVVCSSHVSCVRVSTKVLLRDGISLIFCECVLILLINGKQLHWWQGLVLMTLYLCYFAYMLTSMKSQSERVAIARQQNRKTEEVAKRSRWALMASRLVYWISLGPIIDLERWFVREHHLEQIENGKWNGWPLLVTSTTVMGIACWFLVIACEWLGTGNVEHPSYSLFGYELHGVGMPPMFVAVIFASMATSVPDMVMSLRDARDGDYDDAVANALSSNLFDICIALGFPLFLFTLIHGPIDMSEEVVNQSGELRLILLGLTIVALSIYYTGKRHVTATGAKVVEMRRGKAVALLTIYSLFVCYIIGVSQNSPVVQIISTFLRGILDTLPHLG
ncbi:putative calcium/sodium:proton antiporter [Planctomycetes bacterium CA13]|uniref:Putative calcium/sodium:proton antiporter n=1 Tax=Novipirellula herctigrandis TaxID=2527986 RepID=A0A5C5YVI6_9BACT|nr:putative calcium/sodium:proton antiporter [Planctomycetes bacterium CA13]